jgi:hypothetical protein
LIAGLIFGVVVKSENLIVGKEGNALGAFTFVVLCR